MTSRKCNELNNKYPDFVKGKFGGFEVGEGWYGILDTLCGLITHRITQHNKDVQVRLDKISDGTRTVSEYRDDMLMMMEFPTIRQVKEKFGTLRFYLDTNDKKIDAWVEFAEAMSAVTCEECGAPGEIRHGGWIRCLCDEHEAIYQANHADS